MLSMPTRSGIRLLASTALLIPLLWSGPVSAGPLDCDTISECGWELRVYPLGGNPQTALLYQGNFAIDAEGGVSLAPGTETLYELPDFTFQVDDVSGHVDPEIRYGFSATNNSVAPLIFAMNFNLPLDGATEPLDSYAEVAITLQRPIDAAAQVFPVSGTGFIVDSQDIRLDPFANVDKGVDLVGSDFVVPVDSQFRVDTLFESATSIVDEPGDNSYDIMTTLITFGLSPGAIVTFNGLTRQEVPEPSAALLLGLALAGGAWLRRRPVAVGQ